MRLSFFEFFVIARGRVTPVVQAADGRSVFRCRTVGPVKQSHSVILSGAKNLKILRPPKIVGGLRMTSYVRLLAATRDGGSAVLLGGHFVRNDGGNTILCFPKHFSSNFNRFFTA